MSTSAKRKQIQVASFSMSDISRPHVMSFIAGAVLVALSAAAGWAGSANLRASADSKSAARQLFALSSQVAVGTHGFSAGGGQQLQIAASTAQTAGMAFNDLRASADAPLIAGGLKSAAAGAYASWQNLAAAMNPIGPQIALTATLSEQMGRSAPALASVLKRLESTGRHGGKAYDSAARLYSYAEAGFGLASVPRIEYDLQVLLAEAADLRSELAFVEPVLNVARQASTKKISSEQLKAAYEAAVAAKQAAAELEATATGSQAGQLLQIAAAALAIIGVAAMVFGLRGVVTEFTGRYVRNVQQFRGGEQARSELVAGLRAAGAGDLSPIRLSSSSSDMGEIAALVNDLLSKLDEAVDAAKRGLKRADESGSGVLKIAELTKEAGQNAHQEIDVTTRHLDSCARASTALSLDALALNRAAQEAAARSTDATQVAQDAASRLEAMREGLQDTVKRIKRLGERSQEINGVVDSMEVLSEQIGVLALNAQLEAERAGDSGAGFRLVAREVAALARRSEDALRKIGELVQGVQADARAASESAERSTSQVVAGANVGVVSHSLLGVLAPLAEDIGSMAREVGSLARRASESASESSAGAQRVKDLVTDLVGKTQGLHQPVEAGRRGVTQGLEALAKLQAETATN